MRLIRPLFVPGIFLLLLPTIVGAVPMSVPGSVGTLPCFLGGLAKFCVSDGSFGVARVLETTIFGGAQIVFGAAAMLMFLQYGMRLMLESNDESTITEVKSAYAYGISGAAIVTLSTVIVQIVGQPYGNLAVNNATNLVNTGAVGITLETVIHFFRLLVGTAVAGVVVYQGVRLIILQGQESEMEAQKKRFFHTLIGVAVMTLANEVVTDFVPGAAGYQGSQGLANEMVGIANFFMTLIGGLAVLAFIVAGLFLVFSTDEALKDRAKKTIFTTVIAMIVLVCTYTIVNFVMFLSPTLGKLS